MNQSTATPAIPKAKNRFSRIVHFLIRGLVAIGILFSLTIAYLFSSAIYYQFMGDEIATKEWQNLPQEDRNYYCSPAVLSTVTGFEWSNYDVVDWREVGGQDPYFKFKLALERPLSSSQVSKLKHGKYVVSKKQDKDGTLEVEYLTQPNYFTTFTLTLSPDRKTVEVYDEGQITWSRDNLDRAITNFNSSRNR